MAEAWLHDRIPDAVCARNPELKDLGIYRRLNDDVCRGKGQSPGCEEYVSYCAEQVDRYFSFHKDKLNEWLNGSGNNETKAQAENPAYRSR